MRVLTSHHQSGRFIQHPHYQEGVLRTKLNYAMFVVLEILPGGGGAFEYT